MKKAVMLLVGLLCVGNLYAASLDKMVEKALEKAAFTAVSSQVSKKFNPHLTEGQMRKLPGLLDQLRQHMSRHFWKMSEKEIGWMLHWYYYAEDHCYPGCPYSVDPFTRDEQEHALAYALIKIMPAKYAEEVRENYLPQVYPPVTDWAHFHELCQAYMDRIYRDLVEIWSKGDKKALSILVV